VTYGRDRAGILTWLPTNGGDGSQAPYGLRETDPGKPIATGGFIQLRLHNRIKFERRELCTIGTDTTRNRDGRYDQAGRIDPAVNANELVLTFDLRMTRSPHTVIHDTFHAHRDLPYLTTLSGIDLNDRTDPKCFSTMLDQTADVLGTLILTRAGPHDSVSTNRRDRWANAFRGDKRIDTAYKPREPVQHISVATEDLRPRPLSPHRTTTRLDNAGR